MNSSVIIHHHLGLGDHLDCNGLVRHTLLNEEYDRIIIPAKTHYFNMITFMYRDEPRIEVVEVDPTKEHDSVEKYQKETGFPILTVGFSNYHPSGQHASNKNCWEYFYEEWGIDYEVRKDLFFAERDKKEEERVFDKLNPQGEPFIFIHEDISRGFELDRSHFINPALKTIENDVTENIFHFTKILEEAAEVHCMESSFKTLIDIYCKQENLFYHDFRNQPLGSRGNKNWKVIKYE